MNKREKVEFCKTILNRRFNYQESVQVLKTLQDLLEDCDPGKSLMSCGVGEVLSFIGELYQKGDAEGDPIGFPRDNQIQCIVRKFERTAREKGINPFVDEIGEAWDSFYQKHYRFKLRAEILRGRGELTGNLIHIQNTYADGILVEFGVDLTNKNGGTSRLEEQLTKRRFKAVIISHGHADHNGLIHLIHRDIPVFMGEKTLALYRNRYPEVDTSHFFTYHDGQSFEVGSKKHPIKVTPYLCDHSAPDSYMLLFEYLDRKILYTGDFRSTGRKNYDKLLRKLPEEVTMLICERTNGDDPTKTSLSECALSTQMYRIMKETQKPVFILCPTENIDRIVSAYRASAKARRDFLVDLDQERILETMGGNVPNAGSFSGVRVYFRSASDGIGKPFLDVRGKTVSLDELVGRTDYVMMVKTSTMGYLKKMVSHGAELSGATLIYSLWSGYRETRNMERFLRETELLGVRIVTCHTSGHATQKDIEALISRTEPQEILYVHQRKNDETESGENG